MKFKTLKEVIADQPSMNTRIMRAMKAVPFADQTHMLDALDILKRAGAEGLSPTDWYKSMTELYPSADWDIAKTLATVVKTFKFAVKRIGDKRYAWQPSDSDEFDPAEKAAVGSQIDMANAAMQAMKALGEFTVEELAQEITRKTGMPAEAAAQYADHVMNQFVDGTLERVGPGRYKVKVEPTKTSQDWIDDLKKNAGIR